MLNYRLCCGGKLQDFYVNITNYFITTSKEGVANVNFKIISTSNGKILVAKMQN